MRSIFFDANIIIDWLNKDSAQNELCTSCIAVAVSLYKKPFVSPTTVAITFYTVSKKVKYKQHPKNILKQAFSFFNITEENEEMVRLAFESSYADLEDAIQYYSAIGSKADAIITFNVHDYLKSKIPIMHPAEFLQLHQVS